MSQYRQECATPCRVTVFVDAREYNQKPRGKGSGFVSSGTAQVVPGLAYTAEYFQAGIGPFAIKTAGRAVNNKEG